MKVGKEDPSSVEFVEKRRAALERYHLLNIKLSTCATNGTKILFKEEPMI